MITLNIIFFYFNIFIDSKNKKKKTLIEDNFR